MNNQRMVPAIAGIPHRVLLLIFVKADVLKMIVALVLVLYNGFFSLRRWVPNLTRFALLVALRARHAQMGASRRQCHLGMLMRLKSAP